jgi:hypothetical protein
MTEPYRSATLLNNKTLPEVARKSILRNVLSSEGPWVLINMAHLPAVVMASDNLTRNQWLNAMLAMRDQADED